MLLVSLLRKIGLADRVPHQFRMAMRMNQRKIGAELLRVGMEIVKICCLEEMQLRMELNHRKRSGRTLHLVEMQ